MSQPLPEPHEQMQQLAWFIGEWQIDSSLLVDAEKDEWKTETIRSVHTLEMGGHLIFEHFFGPLNDTPFEAWSLRKFNPQAERWEQRWVDTSPSGFANWTGTWDESAKQFTGYAQRFLDDDYQIAGDKAGREIFDKITDEGFSWRFESTQDGGKTWRTTWTLEYKRSEQR